MQFFSPRQQYYQHLKEQQGWRRRAIRARKGKSTTSLMVCNCTAFLWISFVLGTRSSVIPSRLKNILPSVEKNAARIERKENTYFVKVLIRNFVQCSRLCINKMENGISKIFFLPPKSFCIPRIFNKVISVKILNRVQTCSYIMLLNSTMHNKHYLGMNEGMNESIIIAMF